MFIFKKVVLFVQLISLWVTNRPFGRVIFDINEKYDDINLADLRQLEKLAIKRKKADLDIDFLRKCKLFRVIPKFLSFRIPFGSGHEFVCD